MITAIQIDEKDNVATCTSAANKGEVVRVLDGGEILCVEDIPIWHKIALRAIDKGDKIIKYGEIIGEAAADIAKGAWVSHLNIFSVPRDYESELI